jgi:CHAD domain-containing protein
MAAHTPAFTVKASPVFCLRAGESIDTVIPRVLVALLDQAIDGLQHPGRHRREAIHAVRTAIKNVRALLRLIRPVIGDRIFRRENLRVKSAAQTLAPMRDMAVGLQTLRTFASQGGNQKRRRHFLIVVANYAKWAKARQPASEARIRDASIRSLRASRERLSKLRLPSDDWQLIEPGLEKIYRACRRRMRCAFTDGGNAAFHRCRIRLKNLYFALQFLQTAWPTRLRPLVAGLKKVQQQIGKDHDLAVLESTLQSMPRGHDSDVSIQRALRYLKRRGRKLRRDCRPLVERLLKEKPRSFMRKFARHWATWRTINRKSRHSSTPLEDS